MKQLIKKRQFRLGVLINPYAGIGGALGLKGSDGPAIRQSAIQQGAQLLANDKMKRALQELKHIAADVTFITASEMMGQDCLSECGLNYEVIYTQSSSESQAFDTEQAIERMLHHGMDMLLFAGGDGTARNVFNKVGQAIPVIGVPAGCKIHSGVYAVTPNAAGKVALKVITGELVSQLEGEVRDIDEDAFREGKVIAQHYGEMRVPHDLTYVQSVKMGGQESDELVLQDMVDHVSELISDDPDCFYVMGSGSTVNALMDKMQLSNTLLGVDVIHRETLIGSDVNAAYLERLIHANPHRVKIVITVIGGQGHIFGRGNQQLSPVFLNQLDKQNVLLLASKLKLASLHGRPLRVDTGDERVDEKFRGPISIITGYRDYALYPVE